MDGRRCFIRMGGWTTLFYKDGWMDGRRCFIRMGGRDVVLSGWMDGRRCFIRMGGWCGWTDDVVL